MKILSSKQVHEVDAYTIQHEPISSLQLMERAAIAFSKQFHIDYTNKKRPIAIICGNGNNGGDGLAIARILLKASYDVKVICISSEKQSIDFSKNLIRLQQKHKKKITFIKDISFIDTLSKDTLIIDAIFGTGLNKPIAINSIYHQIIEKINGDTFQDILSVDIPSGLFCDKATNSIFIHSNKTYTFQFPKLAFLLPEPGNSISCFSILDIKLHPDFLNKISTSNYFTTLDDVKNKIKKRKKYSHKGTYGHAMIVAGSYGKAGAATLTSAACLRAGAGLVTAYIPSYCQPVVQSRIPEVMCESDKNSTHITSIPIDNKYATVCIGPGLGMHSATLKAVENYLSQNKKALIIDADGLNLIASKKKLVKLLPKDSILTPHPKEFERLAGKWNTDFERLKLQQEFSKKHKVIIVLKGAHTSISDSNGNVYFNSTGNAGMATAGSGDVLSGIITALAAQQYSFLDSAIIGVFLHGMAGDISLTEQSMESMIASDIIENLGKAFKVIQHSIHE